MPSKGACVSGRFWRNSSGRPIAIYPNGGGVTASLGEVMACIIELEMSAGPGPGQFITRVMNAPSGGEPSAVIQLDVEGLLRNRYALEMTVLASAVAGRKIVSAPEQELRRVGLLLFDALFSGPVLGTY